MNAALALGAWVDAHVLAYRTRERYEARRQRAKCIEEMAELHAALLKLMGYPIGTCSDDDRAAAIDECADVIITCVSVASTTFPDGEWENKLAERIRFKVQRQFGRMAEEKQKEGE